MGASRFPGKRGFWTDAAYWGSRNGFPSMRDAANKVRKPVCALNDLADYHRSTAKPKNWPCKKCRNLTWPNMTWKHDIHEGVFFPVRRDTFSTRKRGNTQRGKRAKEGREIRDQPSRDTWSLDWNRHQQNFRNSWNVNQMKQKMNKTVPLSRGKQTAQL